MSSGTSNWKEIIMIALVVTLAWFLAMRAVLGTSG